MVEDGGSGGGGGGSGGWVLLLLMVPYVVGAWYNRTHCIEQSSLAGVTCQSRAQRRRAQTLSIN